MMGNIIHFMHSMGKSDFADFMEKVLSICSTTFFSMPSSELLSAATSLFYGIPPGTFRYAEKKLLLESVHDSHHLESVAMAVHRLPSGSSIVKVETHNMTRTVHHHFDYEIDGHQRTYRMHSTGPHNVWMNREEDDSKIPYTVRMASTRQVSKSCTATSQLPASAGTVALIAELLGCVFAGQWFTAAFRSDLDFNLAAGYHGRHQR